MELVAVRAAAPAGLDGGAGRLAKAAQLTLVELESSEGICGSGAARGSASLVAEIEQHLGPTVIGSDPTLIQSVIARLRPIASLPALRAIELALWDLVGKAAQLPLYRLWGGYRDRVRCFRTIEPDEPAAELAAHARALADLGVHGIVVALTSSDLDGRLDGMQAARAIIGDEASLAIDWRPTTRAELAPERALPMLHELSELGIGWLEAPWSASQCRELREAGRGTAIPPLAGPEQRAAAAVPLALMQVDCYDILRPSAESFTMLTLWQAAALAESAGAAFMPPAASDGISLIASLHLAAAVPNCEWLELPVEPGEPIALLPDIPSIERDGSIRAPDGPGLGIELPRELFPDLSMSGPR